MFTYNISKKGKGLDLDAELKIKAAYRPIRPVLISVSVA